MHIDNTKIDCGSLYFNIQGRKLFVLDGIFDSIIFGENINKIIRMFNDVFPKSKALAFTFLF